MGWYENQKQRNEEYKAKKATEKEIKEAEKEDYRSLLKSAGKSYAMSTCQYLGGHPNIQSKCVGNLIVNNVGIFFEKSLPFKSFMIPIENVLRADIKTDTQISKDVTLTRLLALGIFAFGVKKKTKEEHNYLVLTYTEDGIENTLLFEANGGVFSKNAGALTSAIAKARQEYAKTHPEPIGQGQLTESVKSTDIVSKLERLAKLKEAGHLTEDEYNAQKAIILNSAK